MLPCVILAGGLGTRMLPRTERLPKSLLPVKGRPFIDWQLNLLARQDLRRLTICAGHLSTALRDHVGDGKRFGMDVTWVDEGELALGTGGALRLAFAQDALDDSFFVLYGDSYLEVPMLAVEEAWRTSGLPALMTVHRNSNRWDASNVVFSGGRVVAYDKSRPVALRRRMRWIDYGLSILTKEVVQTRVAAEGPADLADLLSSLSSDGLLAGYAVRERFYEVGSPGGLAELERHLD